MSTVVPLKPRTRKPADLLQLRIELAGIANRRRWWLVPPGAVVGECRASDSERERAAAGQARDQAGAS